jgi:phospho-N-acetylmuramoyl-pentapeptide-transferase
MFLWLLHHLTLGSDVLTTWDKITPRSALAAGVSFAVAVLLGPWWIAWLRRRFREPIKSGSPELEHLHRNKNSTPTMGGLFIVAALAVSFFLFGDWHNGYTLPAMCVALGMTAVGAVDDLVKLRSPAKGISARKKIAAQTLVAAVAAILLYQQQCAVPDGLLFRMPFGGIEFSLGWWFIPLAVVVIVGASNAVNLTDGLDGLAGGCLIAATAAMTALVYAAGHAGWAAYLDVPRIPHAGEMTVLGAAMLGGVLGFLWFNCHPAQVFMGDTGSLPLGGLLGVLAVVARQELLLAVVAGVFVVEAGSVILQVGYFKWRRRRLLRCAPLHHHFQFLGWPENKIVVRFWIAATLCALLGVGSVCGGRASCVDPDASFSKRINGLFSLSPIVVPSIMQILRVRLRRTNPDPRPIFYQRVFIDITGDKNT